MSCKIKYTQQKSSSQIPLSLVSSQIDRKLLQINDIVYEINWPALYKPDVYIKGLRGYGQKVFYQLLSFRNKPQGIMSREQLMKYVGCKNVCTISRWTSEFERRGLLIKYQEKRGYRSTYVLSPGLTGNDRVMVRCWENQLTSEEQDLWISYRIKPAPKKGYLISTETATPIKKVNYIYKAKLGEVGSGSFAYNSKRGRMEGSLKIPEALDAFKSLKLTLAGKVYLSIYPNEALALADKRLGVKKDITNPIAYIKKICETEVKARGLALNFSLRTKLAMHHRVDLSDNSLFFEKHTINSAQSSSRTQSSSCCMNEICEHSFDPLLHTKNLDEYGNPVYKKRAGSSSVYKKDKVATESDYSMLLARARENIKKYDPHNEWTRFAFEAIKKDIEFYESMLVKQESCDASESKEVCYSVAP